MIDVRSITAESSPWVLHGYSWGLTLEPGIVENLTAEAKANQNNRACICMHPTVVDME